jgi:proteasome accessory factor C
MSARVTAGDRLRRILAVLPWVAERPGVTVGEVTERFGIDRDDLLADLNVVFMVGVYPYTPDALVDVSIDEEDQIEVRLGEAFRRPLALTPAQNLALLAAGSALLTTPGTDPDGPPGPAAWPSWPARSGPTPDAASASIWAMQRPVGNGSCWRRRWRLTTRCGLRYYTLGRDRAEERVGRSLAVAQPGWALVPLGLLSLG